MATIKTIVDHARTPLEWGPLNRRLFIRRDAPRLPLNLDVWVTELLSRVFALLTNLDSTQASRTSGGKGGSSLGGPYREFCWTMALLFSRLVGESKREAVRQTVRFLDSTLFESNVSDPCVLGYCGEIA